MHHAGFVVSFLLFIVLKRFDVRFWRMLGFIVSCLKTLCFFLAEPVSITTFLSVQSSSEVKGTMYGTLTCTCLASFQVTCFYIIPRS